VVGDVKAAFSFFYDLSGRAIACTFSDGTTASFSLKSAQLVIHVPEKYSPLISVELSLLFSPEQSLQHFSLLLFPLVLGEAFIFWLSLQSPFWRSHGGRSTNPVFPCKFCLPPFGNLALLSRVFAQLLRILVFGVPPADETRGGAPSFLQCRVQSGCSPVLPGLTETPCRTE